MKTYRVVWEIDVEAENPKDAAKMARDVQLDPDSIADVFLVTPFDGSEKPVEIDLTKNTMVTRAVRYLLYDDEIVGGVIESYEAAAEAAEIVGDVLILTIGVPNAT